MIAPAPGLAPNSAAAAQQLALRIAAELGVAGVLAVELFETADGALLVNELAMRPHNTGHWTMDGARTSQFEQHLRAVLDLPLGDTAPIAPVTVMVNVLGARQTAGDDHGRAAAPPVRAGSRRRRCTCTARSERPGRKVGHVNILGARRSLDDAYVAMCGNAHAGRTLVVARRMDRRMGRRMR